MKNKEHPAYDSFSSFLSKNLLGKGYKDSENLAKSSLSTEQALAKLKVDNVPPNGAEKLQSVWEN